MKYYLIAGEASGDLHGSKLIQSIQKTDSSADFRAWGGDLMEKSGAVLAKHIRELSIMGIVQVILRLPELLRNFKFCYEDIKQYKPDAIILIDFSGFNLKVAKWAKLNSYKVFYFISPQVWATRAGRIKTIKKYVDKMFVILPFEKEFYNKHNYEVEFVGHPLLDTLENYSPDIDFSKNLGVQKPIIALLPGSRKQELNKILKEMLSIVDYFPNYQFIVAGSANLDKSIYDKFLKKHPTVGLTQGKTYDLLSNAEAALVTSGTATLETAILGIPQVVCYKTNFIFYLIVRMIIKIRFISIVNIIFGKKVISELIQNHLNKKELLKELSEILKPETKARIKNDYSKLKSMLGEKGATDRAANFIVRELNNSSSIN
jgi:lipid-A-disaccharide synthase